MPPLLAETGEGVVEAWGAASSIPAPRTLVAPLLQLDIEREMWQSFAHVRRQRAIRTAKIVFGLVSAPLIFADVPGQDECPLSMARSVKSMCLCTGTFIAYQVHALCLSP
jgi:hypothetical protein